MCELSMLALMERMSSITRWSKSQPLKRESLADHSLQCSMFAHALGVIRNTYYPEAGTVDPERLAVIAMYHDAAEVITEDMNSRFKYASGEMLDLSRRMEALANDMLVSSLPKELQGEFSDLLHPCKEVKRLIKAADLLSAYAKTLAELRGGNLEFKNASEKLLEMLEPFEADLPEVRYFIEKVMPSFSMSVDELVDHITG